MRAWKRIVGAFVLVWAAAGGTVFRAGWEGPYELNVQSVQGCNPKGVPYPQQLIELVADSAGRIHLFSVIGDRRVKDEDPPTIEHFLVEPNGALKREASIESRRWPVTAIAGAAGRDGVVYLGWVEHRGDVVYLAIWKDGKWYGPEVVSDEKAKPGSSAVSVTVDAGEALHVLWEDWREDRFFPMWLFAGEEDSSICHRERLEGRWNSVERVRSSWGAEALDPAAPSGGGAHLFWIELGGAEDRIMHKKLPEQRRPDTVARRDHRLYGFVGDLTVTAGSQDRTFVAWTTSPKARPRENLLEYTSQSNGSWSKTSVLSPQAVHGAWVRLGDSLWMLVQTFGDEDWQARYRERNFPLYFVPVFPHRAAESELVAHKTAAELVRHATGPDGTVHVVYLENMDGKRLALNYVRRVQGP